MTPGIDIAPHRNLTPRQDFVCRKACSFILSEGIRSLPVDPFAIIRRNRWGLTTYSHLGELTDSAAGIGLMLLGSPDGFTIYNGRNYCIAYNDSSQAYRRIVFTLMHEIGHIVLGHFVFFSEGELISRQRPFESEASLFASHVLAPSAVVMRCGLDTPRLLMSACSLSAPAAERRLRQLRGWKPSDCDREVEKAFCEYIRMNNARGFRHEGLSSPDGGEPESAGAV
jgi:hypothetical protein